jgi:Replication initiation factor
MLTPIITQINPTANLAAYILAPGQPNYLDKIPSIYQPEKEWKGQQIELDIECHWLSLEGEINNTKLRELICYIFHTDSCYTDHEGKKKRFKADIGFTHKMVGEYGQYICWTDPNEDTELHKVAVSLPGSWIESHAGLDSIIKKLIRFKNQFNLHTTRVDLAINDYAKKLSLFDCIDAVRSGKYKGFRKYRIIESGDSEEGMTGLTLECGSRESESFTRLYETTVKHDYTANRIECEFKGEKAREVVNKLVQIYYRYEYAVKDGDYLVEKHRQYLADIIAKEASKYVVGQIDFIDRSGQKSNGIIKHCDRLKFWQDFLDRVGKPVKIKVAKKKPSLKTVGKWFMRQIANSIYTLSQGLGIEGFYDFLSILEEKARERLEKDGKLKDSEIMMRIAILHEYGLSAMFTSCKQDVDKAESIMLI